MASGPSPRNCVSAPSQPGTDRRSAAVRMVPVTGDGRRAKAPQRSRKPNSVPPSPAFALRGTSTGSGGDDHSSSLAITGEIKQPTRKRRTGRPSRPSRAVRREHGRVPPYLVLLRAGFCLPPTLRPARCALTAPFHPYSRRAGSPLKCPASRGTWPDSRTRTPEPEHLDGVVRPVLRPHHSAVNRRDASGIFSVPLSFKLP